MRRAACNAFLRQAGQQCQPPPTPQHALEAGMRVPLHGFFCEVLAHFGIAPAQLAPNG
jgi:hypothetical protein